MWQDKCFCNFLATQQDHTENILQLQNVFTDWLLLFVALSGRFPCHGWTRSFGATEKGKRVKNSQLKYFLDELRGGKGWKTHFGVGTSCCPKWRILKYLVHKWGRVEWEWQMNQHSGSCMVWCENLNMKARPWLLLVCWHPHLGLNVVEEWHHRHFFCFCLVVCKISLLCYCKL